MNVVCIVRIEGFELIIRIIEFEMFKIKHLYIFGALKVEFKKFHDPDMFLNEHKNCLKEQ